MGANNADFFAGKEYQDQPGGTTFLHGTNVKLNVGDVIQANGDSLLQSANHGGVFHAEKHAEDARAHTPRAWVIPASSRYITSNNARHGLGYALRAEEVRPTKEKRAYLYQVEPTGKVEKFTSLEDEVSSTSGFRITKLLADVPQSHYHYGNWMDDKQVYLTGHQQTVGTPWDTNDCKECKNTSMRLG